MKRYTAEFFGTFALVFAGTGAIVINSVSGGVITHAGIALTFGLIVLAMIYTVGDISGAHLNPAVTLGFLAAGRFPAREVIPYVTSQLLGAINYTKSVVLAPFAVNAGRPYKLDFRQLFPASIRLAGPPSIRDAIRDADLRLEKIYG